MQSLGCGQAQGEHLRRMQRRSLQTRKAGDLTVLWGENGVESWQ